MRLAILDLQLPDTDGFDVCRAIRAWSRVPVVMLTARDEEVDRVTGLELGADDYVTKPFSPRELVPWYMPCSAGSSPTQPRT